MSLTEQQAKVADLLGTGDSNLEIGKKLYLSENTVKTYVRAILCHYGVENRSAAAACRTRENQGKAKDCDFDSVGDILHEVARLVSEGKENGDISTELAIEVSTVKAYVKRLCTRFGLQNRTQLAAAYAKYAMSKSE